MKILYLARLSAKARQFPQNGITFWKKVEASACLYTSYTLNVQDIENLRYILKHSVISSGASISQFWVSKQFPPL